MDTGTLPSEPSRNPLSEFCAVVAEDLNLFAELHDREPDVELLGGLKETDYPGSQGMLLESQSGQDAGSLMRESLAQMTLPLTAEELDALAADYADIYLTHGYRAAPTESVWLDEDNLERQAPMFEIRQWYRRHDLAVADWRRRPDDHLVPQLQFLAYLLRQGADQDGLQEALDFMDRHMLRWVPAFSARVASRCDTKYFAALVMLTSAYLDELRDLLGRYLGKPRLSAEADREQDSPSTNGKPTQPDSIHR